MGNNPKPQGAVQTGLESKKVYCSNKHYGNLF